MDTLQTETAIPAQQALPGGQHNSRQDNPHNDPHIDPRKDPRKDPRIKPPMTRRDLFLCFLFMGLVSFGGVLPFARRALVEERKWLTSDEFSEGLSLGQILPGPNVVNLSIMVGARFHGPIGSVLAFSGLMLAPLAILLVLATLYGNYGQLPLVQHAIAGTAAASAGLVVAVGYSMVAKQVRSWSTSGVTVLAFIACGLLAWPLLLVLGVLAPFSIFLSWRSRK